jgi:hypothetical protein
MVEKFQDLEMQYTATYYERLNGAEPPRQKPEVLKKESKYQKLLELLETGVTDVPQFLLSASDLIGCQVKD